MNFSSPKTFKQNFDIFKVSLRRKIITSLPFTQKTLVLSRVACFGRDLIDLKYGTKNVFQWNQQKVRVDLFMEYSSHSLRPKTSAILPFLKRSDIKNLLEQQADLPWLSFSKNPNVIILDSFAELTDKKITHKKDGWSFSCHLSDLNLSPLFDRIFQIEGLLAEDKIEDSYKLFFAWLTEKYPATPIYFIHYSTKFDPRELYKKRAQIILDSLLLLEKKYPMIHNVHLENESKILPHETDDFPYHYADSTNQSFLKLLDLTEKNNR